MVVGILSLHIYVHSCSSLKEKRSRIKPLIHRIHREFNVSIAETDYQDKWTECILSVTSASNDIKITREVLNQVVDFIEHNFRDLEIIDNSIEIL